MRQQWFARPLADGEMVIDEPGRVVLIHRYDPPVDDPFAPAVVRRVDLPLLTLGQAHRAPGPGWHG
jgi:hypothetical protein